MATRMTWKFSTSAILCILLPFFANSLPSSSDTEEYVLPYFIQPNTLSPIYLSHLENAEQNFIYPSVSNFLDEHANTSYSTFQEAVNVGEMYVQDVRESVLKPGRQATRNPISVFRMLNRFTKIVSKLRRVLNQTDTNSTLLSTLSRIEDTFYSFPDQHDLNQGMDAFLRLQYIYSLSSNEVAKGSRFKVPLKFQHCFDLASFALLKEYYILAWDWIKVASALATTEEERTMSTTLKQRIQQAHDKYHQTNPTFKQYMFQSRLDQDPNAITEREVRLRTVEFGEELHYPGVALCNGKGLRQAGFSRRKTTCFMKGIPFATQKIEVVHENPDIFLLHDVISHPEIKELKKQALPAMTEIGQDTELRYRCPAVYYVLNSSSIPKIVRKIETAVGWSEGWVTAAKVEASVFGGDSSPKFDVVPMHNFRKLGSSVIPHCSRRTASFRIQLNDVESGGMIVFPKIGVGVKVPKGSGLYWANYNPKDGNVYRSALNYVCPVLEGERWTLTLRPNVDVYVNKLPCDKEYQHEKL